ncbi:MAG: ABC transporter ATP-binding protein [Candidatus Marinimicrobia bacterium]|nr:ABC transporter ATP-binding protein [Candidatus Neomarinimicrobiota bacterium]
MNILSVEYLSVHIHYPDKNIYLLRDISFTLKRGETLAIIGESGCGKSTLCKMIVGLLPPHFQTGGTLNFFKNDNTVIKITNREDPRFKNLRGSNISMVFQDAPGSINPLFKCGKQIVDVLKEHASDSSSQNKQQAIQLIEQVGLSDAEAVFNKYPHQLSGGMSQRIALALALASHPRILMADEPTSSLDSIAKKQYLDLLQELKKKNNLSLILVTHDLNEALGFSDSMLVIYNGHGIEYRNTTDIQRAPAHPYTNALLDIQTALNQNRLPRPIPGATPSITQSIPGCPYHPRCQRASDLCRNTFPLPTALSESHFVCCHRPLETN